MHPSNPDLFINQIGNVLVLTPSDEGRLRSFASRRNVVFQSDTDVTPALTRWVFTDLEHNTLKDQWGNPYDHQVHTLVVGSLQSGQNLLEELERAGCIVSHNTDLFVPFKTLDLTDEHSSDRLRTTHARAFALARRDIPNLAQLTTTLRDSIVVG